MILKGNRLICSFSTAHTEWEQLKGSEQVSGKRATPDITGLPGVHIECKRAQQQSLYAWIEQARRDADKFHDGLPAVLWRKNCRPWLVVMDLRDWMDLYDRQKPPKANNILHRNGPAAPIEEKT